MGLAYSSGLTSITGNVAVTTTSALPTPGASQTNIRAYAGRGGTSGSITLFTTTVSKIAYVQSISIGTFQNASAAKDLYIVIYDNATLIWQGYTGSQGNKEMIFPAPLQITTSLVINVTVTGGSDRLDVLAVGFEQ